MRIKRTRDPNRNVLATVSHDKYKDVLLNNNCLRHSINRIPSKDHKTRTYEVNKVLTCLALITNYISKTMGMMDQLLAIRDNIKPVIYYKKLS